MQKLAIVLAVAGACLTPVSAQQLDDISVVDIPEVAPLQIARFDTTSIIVKPRTLTRADGQLGILTSEEALPFGLEVSPALGSGGTLIYSLSPQWVTSDGGRSAEEVRAQVLAIVDALNERADVEYAEPNYIAQPHGDPTDQFYPAMWHYQMAGTAPLVPGGISLSAAWQRSVGSREVVVAVIDTGQIFEHPDIGGSSNLGSGFDMISTTAQANDGDGRDPDPTDAGDAAATGECYPGSPPSGDSWHGTHVSGTIGAGLTNNQMGIAGVNWEVTILPIRVLGKCGGTFADINDAIRWAAGLAVPGLEPNRTPAKVINMSLGATVACPQSQQEAITDAYNAGAMVVVSAGNNAADASGNSPASCEHVVTVAASDARGFLADRYSAFGDTIEILAPGGDVRRDDNGDGQPDGVLSYVRDGVAWYNGTSMAAPHVAGVAAWILAQDLSLSPDDVLHLLQDNALARDSSQCPNPCGAGLLHANIILP